LKQLEAVLAVVLQTEIPLYLQHQYGIKMVDPGAEEPTNKILVLNQMHQHLFGEWEIFRSLLHLKEIME
jgi:hypothetical protein